MKRAITITDEQTGEILDAEIESIILAVRKDKVKAMMVVTFDAADYQALMEWLESLRNDGKVGIKNRPSIPDATGDSDT